MSVYTIDELGFDTWVLMRQGLVLALNIPKNKELEGPGGRIHTIAIPLEEGAMVFFSKDSRLRFMFQEDSLIELGCIVSAPSANEI